ncbi:Translin [Dacryopinax primogenitus]|uniref:Translin n=1 Tax=Dacryopinax primogenitus (strain DJM 731) TaxID=1858805 RepID=M5GAV1_DACPD|nr:Translin [Dacryopinax primogenitus]EJU03107.1 Translin [Dacryopinax primogenitus]
MDEREFGEITVQLEQEATLREKLKDESSKLDQKSRSMQGIMNKIHATPTSQLPKLIETVKPLIESCKQNAKAMAEIVPPNSFWRWKNTWAQSIQGIVFVLALCRFLEKGTLITLSEANEAIGVQEEWSDRFTIATEDYLQGIISLVNELSRLTVNAVTLGDFDAPFRISIFVKDLFAGFSLLNLKNDGMRRRFDSLKYDVKRIEEVVYDVSLRKLNM